MDGIGQRAATLVLLGCALVLPVTGIYVIESDGRKSSVPLTHQHWTDVGEDSGGLWSSLLEDYTLGFNTTSRQSRVMQGTVIQTQKYIPTSSFYINKRIGEAMELEPHHRLPQTAKVIAATNPYGENQLNSPTGHGTFTPMRQTFGGASPTELLASPREVSETDLYLLGAIEKLVYRVDYMENRLRRAEQIIYFLMAGNNQKPEACPQNFTQVHDRCYHFDIERGLNWKSASTMCKSYGAHLAEFETIAEFQDVVAYILNNPVNRGKNFWLGGLNPGLLWIWAHSAKPVNPNTNLTSITAPKADQQGTSTTSTTTVKPETKKPGTKVAKNPAKQQPTLDIIGNGRCLRLSYNPALYTYGYMGEDCSAPYSYVCELKDKTLDNEIARISKDLKLKDIV